MLRFAYADPPYLGMCGKHYGHRHDPPWGCWNDLDTHRALIDSLAAFDGWALSSGSSQLQRILALCPDDVRIGAWCKPFANFRPGVNPGYTWEPVIFRGARRRTDRTEPTVRDYLVESRPHTLGLPGAKPASFCRWVLDLLGYRDCDEMTDIFPGTGGLGRAAEQSRLALSSGGSDHAR